MYYFFSIRIILSIMVCFIYRIYLHISYYFANKLRQIMTQDVRIVFSCQTLELISQYINCNKSHEFYVLNTLFIVSIQLDRFVEIHI